MPTSRSSSGRGRFLGHHLVDGKCLRCRAENPDTKCLPSTRRCPPAARDFGFVSNRAAWRAALSRWRCCDPNPFVSNCRLGGFAARIANRTGRAAGHGNRMMAEQLKPAQRQQRDEIAETCRLSRRRVKTAVSVIGRRCVLASSGPRRCNQPPEPRHLIRPKYSIGGKSYRVCGRRAQGKGQTRISRPMIELPLQCRPV